MVVVSLSSRLNKRVGPLLLRHGLSARYALGGGVIRDNPTLDALLLTPFAQTLISIETQDDSTAALKRARAEKKVPSALDKFVDKTFDRIFGADVNEKNEEYAADSETGSPSVMTHDGPNLRLEALERYLRPALIPNERWSDVHRWQFNTRFLKWARAEFLIAKHGPALRMALERHPELRVEPLMRKRTSKDPLLRVFGVFGGSVGGSATNGEKIRLLLPSSKLVAIAFGMQNWNRRKDDDAAGSRMKEIASRLGAKVQRVSGSALRYADVPPDADLSILSLEDVLEVAGGHVASCGPFNVLCEEGGIYEFWTKEYMTALASYVLDRSEDFEGDTLVLDVGAGDGTLAHFLRECIDVEARKRSNRISPARKRGKAGRRTMRSGAKGVNLPQVVATDDGSWNIEPMADVEKLHVKDAVAKYSQKGITRGKRRQLIVICSWMPMGEDWTKDIRSEGADEYILIGECDDGTCGDNWATWGNPDFWDEDASNLASNSGSEGDVTSGIVATAEPPYVEDGFVRQNLDHLSLLQFSRFDCGDSSSSKTVSFRRVV